MKRDPDATLFRKMVLLLKQLNMYLNHFPKHEKYALCQRIRNNAYDVFDLITEGEKRYHKKTTLTELDIAHERLRMEVYLANELDYFSYHNGEKDEDGLHRFMTLTKMVDEIGCMIGGWINAMREA